MNKILFLVASATFLTGCAVTYAPVNPTKEFVDYPEVGDRVTARVGDRMLVKGVKHTGEALVLEAPVGGVLYSIAPGTYRMIGRKDEEEFFDPSGIRKSGLADDFQLMSVSKAQPHRLCVVTVFASRACYDADFKIETVTSERAASFQQTLLYSGKSGDKVRLSYREFADSFARPAYSNDVEYDLLESRIVGYKGAEIKVIDANNMSITYEVLSTFDDLE